MNDKIKELLNRPGNEDRKKNYEDTLKKHKELSEADIDENGMKKLKKGTIPEETRLELERIALVQQQDKLKAEQYRQERIQRARAAMAEKKKNDPAWNYTIQSKDDSETESDEEDDRSTARRTVDAVGSGVGAVTSRLGSGLSALASYVTGSKDAEADAIAKKKQADKEREEAEAAKRMIAEKLRKTKADAAERERLEKQLQEQEAARQKAQRDAEAAERAAEQAIREKMENERQARLAAADERRKQEALVQEQRRKAAEAAAEAERKRKAAAAAEAERKRKADEEAKRKMLQEQAELAKKAAAAKSAQTSSVNPNVQKLIDLYGENSAIKKSGGFGPTAYVDYPLKTLMDNGSAPGMDNQVAAAKRVVGAAANNDVRKGGLNVGDMRIFLYGYSGNRGLWMGAEMQPDGTPYTSLENFNKNKKTSSVICRERLRKLVNEAQAGRLLKAEKEIDSEGPTPERPVDDNREQNLSQIPQSPPFKPQVKREAPPAPKKASGSRTIKGRPAEYWQGRLDKAPDKAKALRLILKGMGLKSPKSKVEMREKIQDAIDGKIPTTSLMDSGIDLDYSLSCHRDKKKKNEVMLSGYDSEGDELTKPTAMICPTLGLADRKLMELIV